MKTTLPKSASLSLATLLLISLLGGCNSDDAELVSEDTTETETTSLTVAADETLAVDETTSVDELTIEDGATLEAADGYSLTLTVDGVETEIAAGSYSGDVVLTVTEEIPVAYSESITNYFRTAVYVEDGAYVADKSVAAAVIDGDVSDTEASALSITSVGPEFNGIMITSSDDSTDVFEYLIDSPTIDFTGNGGNDFSGYGAAVMSSGYADVQLNNASITTTGAIRTAVFVGGNSVMTVNNSVIETYNGTLPEDYEFNVDLGRMMEAPWMLGITGNVRSTNLVDNGTAYYINSSVTSQAWGALSTDDTTSTRLYCLNSQISTTESGYGFYSIGDNLDYVSGCTVDVADYGMIMAAIGNGTFTDGTVVNSGRIGVMLHSGTGTLRIENGTVFNVAESVIQAKSSFPTVIVDDAELNSDIGVILQMMDNDDPYGAYLQSLSAKTESTDTDEEVTTAAAEDASSLNEGGSSNVLTATFSNATLSGDVVNGNTGNGELELTLESTTLTGAITTATSTAAYLNYYDDAASYFEAVVSAEGYDGYTLIGQVTNVYEATGNDYGVTLTVDSSSSWVVDTTSYLTNLTLEDGGSISVADGYSLTMTVDGVETDIAAGTYSGAIVMTVTAE